MKLRLRQARLQLDDALNQKDDLLLAQGGKAGVDTTVSAEKLKLINTISGYDKARLAIEQAEYELSQACTHAPFGGVVAGVQVRLYQRVNAGEVICTLIDPARFEAESQLLEKEAIRVRQGQPLPLRYFISVERAEAYKELTAGRAGETLSLRFDRNDPGLVAGIRDFLRHDGRLTAYFTGQHFENRQLLRELAVVMGVSLLLLYLILAAQFESVVQPLVVILTVPVGLAGALLLLYLAGESLNLVDVIGGLALGTVASLYFVPVLYAGLARSAFLI